MASQCPVCRGPLLAVVGPDGTPGPLCCSLHPFEHYEHTRGPGFRPAAAVRRRARPWLSKREIANWGKEKR